MENIFDCRSELKKNSLKEYLKIDSGVSIYLLNGVCLKGTIDSFDDKNIIINSSGRGKQIVFFHAISTISFNNEMA